MPGAPADRAPDTRTADAADSLAAFLTALHRPAPDGAPIARRREEHNYGGRLAERAEQFAEQLASATELGLIPNPDAVLAMWEDAVAAHGWAGPALWLHGDLHLANVPTVDGTFCGVIDFGDLCAGDPACDLTVVGLLPDGAADRPCGPVEQPARLTRAVEDASTWHGTDKYQFRRCPVQPTARASWERAGLQVPARTMQHS
jgi:aminoglycoside phosphotransferase (APT) family kinase protein